MSLGNNAARGFVSTPIAGGGTWTHTTRLGDFLAKAERRFGPRQMEWTVLGVEFFGHCPQIWYPGDRRHVVVRLTEAARFDEGMALFQLAHEVVHLLSPSGGGPALFIEEGMAVLFAEEMMADSGMDVVADLNERYDSAGRMTKSLLEGRPDIIRRIRSTHPRIQDFSPQILMQAAPDLSVDDAERLCTPFGW